MSLILHYKIIKKIIFGLGGFLVLGASYFGLSLYDLGEFLAIQIESLELVEEKEAVVEDVASKLK